MAEKDRRIKMMNEILSGIKVRNFKDFLAVSLTSLTLFILISFVLKTLATRVSVLVIFYRNVLCNS